MTGLVCALLATWLACSRTGVFAALVRPVVSVRASVSVSSPALPEPFNFTMAQFGAMPYGRTFEAQVYMPRGRCGSAPCSSGCSKIDTFSNPSPSNNTAWVYVLPDDSRFPCSDVRRAFHAQQHGASAVLFVPETSSGQSSTEHIVSTQDRGYLETSIMLSKVHVPVGRIDLEGGRIVLDSIQQGDSEQGVEVTFDFRDIAERSGIVEVELWHNTADSCGPLCDLSTQFMADMAALQKSLPNVINVFPRFMFNICDQPWSTSCNASCAVGGKYCVYQPGAMSVPGRPAALENLRQLCLRNVLLAHKFDLTAYWEYLVAFQKNCRTSSSDLTHICSEQTFDQHVSSEVKKAWEQCFARVPGAFADVVTDFPDNVSAADDEFAAMLEASVTPHEGVEVIINGVPFRGLFDKDQVLRAACSQLANPETVGACKVAQGLCAPNSEGALACRQAASAERHTTTCMEDDSDAGYHCVCGPGFMNTSAAADNPECIDTNECSEYKSLCDRMSSNRNVCVNDDGHFECEFDVQNECNAQAGWGQCWVVELEGKNVSSCVDRFRQYKSEAILGFPDGKPSISECACEEMDGCWSTRRGGACEQECPDEECNTYTKKCFNGSKTGRRARKIVLAVVSSVIGLVLLLAMGMWCSHRRRKMLERDRVVHRYQAMVSAHYANFRDGMDGDEMASVTRDSSLVKHMLSTSKSMSDRTASSYSTTVKPTDPSAPGF